MACLLFVNTTCKMIYNALHLLPYRLEVGLVNVMTSQPAMPCASRLCSAYVMYYVHERGNV